MNKRLNFLVVSFFLSSSVWGAESLSYSGRLVNANGSPVTGPVSLQFNLSYTDVPRYVICNKTISGVALTNGVFHTKLDYTVADCGGTLSLQKVITDVPPNESIAIQVNDVTDPNDIKPYAYQAIHSIPTAITSSVAKVAKTLEQMGATNGQVLKWDGTKWAPAADGGGSTTTGVTGLRNGTGISTGPTNGVHVGELTIGIIPGGVGGPELAASSVTDVKINPAAAIARTKLAGGAASTFVYNNASGVMSDLNAASARTALGLGDAALATVGIASGNVLPATGILTCLGTQKLQMNPGPVFWSCVNDNDTDVTKLPLNGSGTMTGALNMGSQVISSLAPPVAGTDATNKDYVNTLVGLNSHWTLVGTGPNIYRATGNVGMGTPTPQAALDIVSTTSGILIPRMTTIERNAIPVAGRIGMQVYDTNLNKIYFHDDIGWKALGEAAAGFVNEGNTFPGAATLGTNDAFPLNFETGGTTKMTILNDGNVGIGTTTPTKTLSVVGEATFTGGAPFSSITVEKTSDNGAVITGANLSNGGPVVRFKSDSGANYGWQIASRGDNFNVEETNGSWGAASNHLTILKTNGNVGIGTTSPNAKLTVNGNISFPFGLGTTTIGINDPPPTGMPGNNLSIKAGNANSGGTGPVGGDLKLYAGYNLNNSYSFGNPGTIRFHTGHNSPEVMTILHSGNVGIGTSAPAARLDITSTTSGILIPRMTTAERVAILPATAGLEGMQVYDTQTDEIWFIKDNAWVALGAAGSGITSITVGAGLTPTGTITTTGSIAVDTGTTADKIVKLDNTAKLPAVDGSALTNLNPANLSVAVPLAKGGTGLTAGGTANQFLAMHPSSGALEYKSVTATSPLSIDYTTAGAAPITLGTVPYNKGGTSLTSFTGDRLFKSNNLGTAFETFNCNADEVLKFGTLGVPGCATIASLTAGSFVNGGNSFTGPAVLGTNDNNTLSFETFNLTKMTILANGNVGIGTTLPRATLDVSGTFLGKPATLNVSTTIDFSVGNLQYTAADCGNYQLNNLKDGGQYSFIIQGITSATCSFTAFSDAGTTAFTVKMPPSHGPTINGAETLYSFMVVGTKVYITWIPGY